VNFTNIFPCFSFADVTQNVDMRFSKNSRLQHNIEAAVRDPRPLFHDLPVGNH